jgi:hypothetical protein
MAARRAAREDAKAAVTAVPAAAPVDATPLAQMIAQDGALISAIRIVRQAVRIAVEVLDVLRTVKAAALTVAKVTATAIAEHSVQITAIVPAMDALEVVRAAAQAARAGFSEKGMWNGYLF